MGSIHIYLCPHKIATIYQILLNLAIMIESRHVAISDKKYKYEANRFKLITKWEVFSMFGPMPDIEWKVTNYFWVSLNEVTFYGSMRWWVKNSPTKTKIVNTFLLLIFWGEGLMLYLPVVFFVSSAIFFANALKLSCCKTLQYVTKPNNIKSTAIRIFEPPGLLSKNSTYKGYKPNVEIFSVGTQTAFVTHLVTAVS